MRIQSGPRLFWIIGTAVVSRVSLNTARRFAYPFAPVLSRGLGVPLSAITSLIAMNQATSILSIFFAPLGDHLGYREMMLTGLGILAVGMLAGGFLPFYGMIMAALFLAGLGKSIFDPALQAYIGEQVPYQRRGFVIGLGELSWAGSSLIGIPLVGLLIDRLGWRSPFFALSGIALFGIILLSMFVPHTGKRPVKTRFPVVSVWNSWRVLGQKRTAISVLCYAFLVSAANKNLFVVYGAWLERTFGLSVVALGLSTSVIGLAELSGEGLTVFLSDRLGPKRSTWFGLTLSSISYLVLPALGRSLPLALTGLFVVFITLEFTFVTSLSISSEILPEARATMMAGVLAASGIGSICGTLLGGKLWVAERMFVIGLVSAFMSGAALIVLIWGLRDWQPKS